MTDIYGKEQRATALSGAKIYRIDTAMGGSSVRVIAAVHSFTPDENGFITLIGAHLIAENRVNGKLKSIRLVPMVSWSETTTIKVRSESVLEYALAAQNMSAAFFDKMSVEIAEGPEDIGTQDVEVDA